MQGVRLGHLIIRSLVDDEASQHRQCMRLVGGYLCLGVGNAHFISPIHLFEDGRPIVFMEQAWLRGGMDHMEINPISIAMVEEQSLNVRRVVVYVQCVPNVRLRQPHRQHEFFEPHEMLDRNMDILVRLQ